MSHHSCFGTTLNRFLTLFSLFLFDTLHLNHLYRLTLFLRLSLFFLPPNVRIQFYKYTIRRVVNTVVSTLWQT